MTFSVPMSPQSVSRSSQVERDCLDLAAETPEGVLDARLEHKASRPNESSIEDSSCF